MSQYETRVWSTSDNFVFHRICVLLVLNLSELSCTYSHLLDVSTCGFHMKSQRIGISSGHYKI